MAPVGSLWTLPVCVAQEVASHTMRCQDYAGPQGGPDVALHVWVTEEQEGLQGEHTPRNLLLLFTLGPRRPPVAPGVYGTGIEDAARSE